MTTLNGDIFVAGGLGDSNRLSTVSKYSLRTDTWTEVEAMNERRNALELVTLNGEIYAIGGRNTETVERYNL